MRERYFDSLRLIAIFIVYTTHFIAFYDDSFFSLWSTMPTSLLLNGVTGKLGVVILAVILGYFAIQSGIKKKNGYVVKRYIYFMLAGLFINSCYYIAEIFDVYNKGTDIWSVLWNSITIGDGIYNTFWCMDDFLIGSILCYIIGKYKLKTIEIAYLIVIFVILNNVWISICLMGALLYRVNEYERIQKICSMAWYCILQFLIVFVVIKRPESDLTYFLDACCVLLFLLAIINNDGIKKLFQNKMVSNIGENCMEIFLIHPMVYRIIGGYLFECFVDVTYNFRFVIVWMLTFVVIVLISYPVKWIIGFMTKICYRIIDKIIFKYQDIA